jgi:hypothetical protein
MVYMPVIIPVLRKMGILKKVMANAFLNYEGAVWGTPDGEELAKLELSAEGAGKENAAARAQREHGEDLGHVL